jgi:hypothetical protein
LKSKSISITWNPNSDPSLEIQIQIHQFEIQIQNPSLEIQIQIPLLKSKSKSINLKSKFKIHHLKSKFRSISWNPNPNPSIWNPNSKSITWNPNPNPNPSIENPLAIYKYHEKDRTFRSSYIFPSFILITPLYTSQKYIVSLYVYLKPREDNKKVLLLYPTFGLEDIYLHMYIRDIGS